MILQALMPNLDDEEALVALLGALERYGLSINDVPNEALRMRLREMQIARKES